MKIKLLVTFILLSNCLFYSQVSAKTIKIVVLSDLHVTPGNKNEKQLAKAVEEINSSDADAVIVNGDLTNEGSDLQLQNVKSVLDGITKPQYVIPGNHENNWSQSACKTFVDLWGADRFIFEIDDLVIAGINCGPFMKMGDGHVKQEDLIWLNENLKQRVTKGKRFLSFCHYAPNPDLDNYVDYIKILEQYPTITHINGHYHKYDRYKAGDIDGLMVRALDSGKENYGYSKLEITNDSIKVFDKQLGKSEKLKFAYKINTNFTPLSVPTETITELPSYVKISLVYRDNASVFTRIGFDKKNVYFGNSLGYIKAVDKCSGELKWQYKTEAMLFSRPAVGEKEIVIPTADKRMLWLNKKTGKLKFQHKSPKPYMADGIVENGILYQGGSNVFEAWNIEKHKLLWAYDSIFNYCQAAPVISGEDVIFGAWDTNLRSLNKVTGKLNWVWNNGNNANMLGPGNCVPVVNDCHVIIVAPDRFMTMLDKKTGQQIWRNKSHKFRESLGTSTDGNMAYSKTMDGEIVAVSMVENQYKEEWITDTKLGYEHAPCIVLESNGIIYVGSRRGIMVAIDAHTHQVLWTYKLGSSEFNGWEVDENGDVFTSLIEGTIWKVSVKK